MYKNCIILLILTIGMSFGCDSGTSDSPCEINVSQGSTNIVNAGSYDFGQVNVNADSGKISFTIRNEGSGDLSLTGIPDLIEISGSDPSMFVLDQTMTQDTVESSGATSFDITFKPSSEGVKSATISIPNNDLDEAPYTFTLNGTAVGLPEINVKQGSTDITNNTGVYDFGSIRINKYSPAITFTIENLGTTTLQLTNTSNFITMTGTDASMFSLNQASTIGVITQGNSTSFNITFMPTSVGDKSAVISIANDDSDENPYTFTIKGKCFHTFPEINVKQVKDIPCTTGSYDFGQVIIGGSTADIDFTIENLGTENLNLTGSTKISIAGTDPKMFVINQSMTTSPIAPSGSTTFKVKFSPTSAGSKSAMISISNNDSDENPYTFTLKGSTSSGYAVGWIGGGKDGWQTSTAPSSSADDYRSFAYPKSTCVDTSGNIYTADTSNHRVCKWDSKGNVVGWIGGGKDGWQIGKAPVAGTDFKSFDNPSGVSVNISGDIFVADTNNNRICLWDSKGNAIGWFGGGVNGLQKTNAPLPGNDYMSFDSPTDVFVNSSNDSYVADSKNNRICKWDKQQSAVGWVGGGSNGWKTGKGALAGSDYQSLNGPCSLCVDSSGVIYVTDTTNHRVCRWDGNGGNAKGWIGGGMDTWQTTSGATSGQDYRSFLGPSGIAVGSKGTLYIADTYNYRICKWSNSGKAVGWIGGGKDGWQTGSAPTFGHDLRSFEQVFGICLDSSGSLFIADTLNHRVCKWSD